MPRTCRKCDQHTGPTRRLCKPCALDERDTRDPTTPLETETGDTVGAWIRVDETWHASVSFDGYVHDFACSETFDDFPAADASIDHHALEHDSICIDCRAAIAAESMPEPWQRVIADGGRIENLDRPAWNPRPTDDTQHTCLGCGEHVQPGTIRIYGTNDGKLFACTNCSTPRDLRQGAGSNPDYDPERDRGQSTASGYHPIFGGGDE